MHINNLQNTCKNIDTDTRNQKKLHVEKRQLMHSRIRIVLFYE